MDSTNQLSTTGQYGRGKIRDAPAEALDGSAGLVNSCGFSIHLMSGKFPDGFLRGLESIPDYVDRSDREI